MFKRTIWLLLLSVIIVPSINSQFIEKERGSALRFYIRSDFNDKDPRFEGKPIFGRVRHAYVPPEILKEVPKETRILNPDGFELVNISPGNNAQSETWIAINPTNPNNIIATSNDNMYMTGTYRMSSWASFDGGKTWKHANTPPNRGYVIDLKPGGSMTIFDPTITFDTDGNAYYAYGFTQINNNQQMPDDNGVFVAKSTDGGLTWNGDFAGDPISIAALELGNKAGQPFHDRYTIASDMNHNSPYKDFIYLAWQKFNPTTQDQVVVAISKDKGVTWGQPAVLFQGTGTQSPVPAVGPDGEVYVVWQSRNRDNHTTQAVVRRSTNGGVVWTPGVTAMQVFTVGEIIPEVNINRYVMANKQNIRVSSYPAIAVDRTPVGSPTRGYAYIVQAGRDAAGGPYGIYLTKSTNKGQSWTEKKRIDDATLRNDLFFPAVCVDNTNGMVAILYYSSQNDPNNVGVDAYLAVSRDAGETFTNIRLTPSSIFLSQPGTVSQQDAQASNIYWGDYTHIAAHGGKIYPLWWWPTGPTHHYGTLDLFTALVSTSPKPPTNYVAISQFSDQQVKIKMTWENPTHDLLGGELNEYVIEIFRNSNKIVELPKLTTEYIDTDVADGQSYHYQIRVVANGDASVFVDRQIYAGGSLKPSTPTEVVAKPNSNGVLVQWLNPTTSVDGSDIRNLERIDIYHNNNKVATAGKAQIAAGETSSIVVPFETEKFYYLKLKSVTARDGVETESDFSEEVFSFSGAPLLTYNDNFDSQTMGIPRYDLVRNWGLASNAFASAPNSLNQSSGEIYRSSTNYRTILAPTIVSNDRKRLNYNLLAKIHTSDFGHLFISRDFGKTFVEVMRFNENSNSKFQGILENTEFVNVSFDLTPYMGDTIYFKFGLSSNPIREDWGIFIDDIVVDGMVGVEEHYNPIYNNLFAQVMPNPINNNSHLSINIPIAGDMSIAIYDLLGNKAFDIAKYYTNSGSFNFALNTDHLSSGMYIVRISLNGHIKTIPIIKQ